MSIFQPSHIFSSQRQEDTEEVYVFYTMAGNEDFLDQDSFPRLKQDGQDVYAKKTTRIDGSIKYLIRTGLDKKLYNPISPIDKESNRQFLDRVSRSNDRFRSVNQKVFDWYLRFLQTKNTAWLYNAEREAE
mgnify:CR=1 FL=1